MINSIKKNIEVKDLLIDTPTKAGFLYSKEKVKKTLDESISGNQLYLTITHPLDELEENASQVDLRNIAGKVLKYKIQKNSLYIDVEVLKTPKGQLFDDLLKNKKDFTVRPRAFGNILPDKKIDALNIIAFDLEYLRVNRKGNMT